jgi:glycolate oxidase iron-sulfur subunit
VDPEAIATANVGCQLHLESACDRPVQHWVEILDAALAAGTNPAHRTG